MTSANDRLRIIVLGYIVRGPLGGLVWHHLQYVLGLARLGHEVYYLEDSDDYPSCYDPMRQHTSTDPSYGLRFARRLFDRVGLGDRWAYYDAHTARWFGPCGERAEHLGASSDLLLNLSGITPLRPWFMPVPARVYLDTDPVFTQIRHLTDARARASALRHTRFFSFGGTLGARDATVPDDGFPWRPTRQPVVLDAWPVTPPPARVRFTTVLQWQSYAAPSYAGVHYGMKAEAFKPYLDLPQRAGRVLELALAGTGAPRDTLRAHGWRPRDPAPLSRTPWTYRRYIQRSSGEFSVAKAGYVTSRCGWFSERSACYLASGRPAIVQDTGFSALLPTGAGLLAFSSPDEAVAAIQTVVADYPRHAAAARALAETYFAAPTVLDRLLRDALGSPA